MTTKLEQCCVEDLALGMYVEQLDRPWTDTPLPFQGFYIRSPAELQQLRDCCDYVYVDSGKRNSKHQYEKLRAAATKKSFISECLDLNRQLPPPPVSVPRPTTSLGRRLSSLKRRVFGKAGTSTLKRVVEKSSEDTQRLQALLQESVRKAERTHHKAQQVMTKVFEDCRAGGGLDINSIEQVVTPVIDSVLDTPDAMACVVRMRAKDQYTYNHALATSVWAVVFGKFLGFDIDNLRTLGLGGLVLDIGKTRIADALLNKSEALSADELQEIRRHVDYGLEILAETPSVDPRVVKMLETHHERYDGSGYPNGLQEDDIPVFGRIAGIVDSYDAMTSLRPYAPARSTYHAMRHLLDQSDILFQSEMIERFIQVVGIFPTATLVEMNTGEVGIVVEQNHIRRLRPKIMMVLDTDKKMLSDFPIVDLAETPAEQDAVEGSKWIVRGLETGSYGIDPTEYYL